MSNEIKYREQWLTEGMHQLNQLVFTPAKYKIPKDVRVSCGFPHTNAFGTRRRTLGECWYPRSNTPHELFISPLEGESLRVLDILTHEIVHTVAGKDAKHGKQFAHVATRVGLTGKMTSTIAGPALTKVLTSIVGQLGAYPHVAMDPALKKANPRGPTTAKAACDCGYYVRIPYKFLEFGLPDCPACGTGLGVILPGN